VSSAHTRARILAAARGLLESGDADAAMGRIARAAGVTRQLLYLHFEGRADLLLALTRAVDEEVRPAAQQERVDAAPDGRTALREAVALQARIKPRIAAVAAAIDRLRPTDPDAAAAWREREDARFDRARQVVGRLAAEGLLRPDLPTDDAARLLWSATSLRAWTELVVESGWTAEQWVRRTAELLERSLLQPGG
jgi:AcrR family transcriptional regulator